MNSSTITIVSGLQRSGTAMMMQMLQAGGMEVLTKDSKQPDQHNLNGYFEHSDIMRGKSGSDLMEDAIGKAIKVYAGLMPKFLTKDHVYKIVFMERNLKEVWSSFQAVRKSAGKPKANATFFNVRRKETYKIVIERVKSLVDSNDNLAALFVDYDAVLENPVAEASRVNDFLGGQLCVDSMARAVDTCLKHQDGDRSFLVTDRAPIEVAKLIDQFAAGKVYCEIGIGEGHHLNAVSAPAKIFGVEKTEYGVNRCKKLYPDIEVIHGDILELIPTIEFEACYMWLTYPTQKEVVTAVLQKNSGATVLMGLNYFYHLDRNDEKAWTYMEAYPPEAHAHSWNRLIDEHLEELSELGFKHQIAQIVGQNQEIFSVAVIQRRNGNTAS